MATRLQIDVSRAEVEELQRRVSATRWLPPPAGEPWESGVDYEDLRDLADYWATGFDWMARQRWLNQFEHHLVDISGQSVHFVSISADRERYHDPIPMVVTHGWPYSFVEFLEFASVLSDPHRHDGGSDVAFDVVIPSLPGYGYSAPLTPGPFTSDVVARLWHHLMTVELGHPRFVTYGEDVGASVSDWIGALFPESVLGLFATHAAFPPEERSSQLSPDEKEFRDWLEEKWRTAAGYSAMQSTRPDTLAVGLGDSPVGLLAWLLEKFREWSGPDFETAWSKDDILTTTSLYWFTGTIGTSFLPYFDGRRHEKPLPLVGVPVGVAVQWGERGMPRSYAERTYTDLRYWEDLSEGGHFTAKQSPTAVAAAIRRFLGTLDSQSIRG